MRLSLELISTELARQNIRKCVCALSDRLKSRQEQFRNLHLDSSIQIENRLVSPSVCRLRQKDHLCLNVLILGGSLKLFIEKNPV